MALGLARVIVPGMIVSTADSHSPPCASVGCAVLPDFIANAVATRAVELQPLWRGTPQLLITQSIHGGRLFERYAVKIGDRQVAVGFAQILGQTMRFDIHVAAQFRRLGITGASVH